MVEMKAQKQLEANTCTEGMGITLSNFVFLFKGGKLAKSWWINSVLGGRDEHGISTAESSGTVHRSSQSLVITPCDTAAPNRARRKMSQLKKNNKYSIFST
jgi:hypothetical protein